MQETLKQRLSDYLIKYALSSQDDPLHFSDIYTSIPSATRLMFVETVKGMQSPVVIEIASLYGEEFGLWIAKQNPHAEVHVYNPQTLDTFAPVLFNHWNPDIVAKIHSTTSFDPANPEESINRLYRTNELYHITFHKQAVHQRDLEEIAEQYAPQKVVFVSLRTPTVPQEMTSQIAHATARYPHTHMILAPYINTEIQAYTDDPVVGFINNSWRRLVSGKGSEQYDIENMEARVFIAFSLYYACLSAEQAYATVYRNAVQSNGFPFQHPCCFVSTIKPQQ